MDEATEAVVPADAAEPIQLVAVGPAEKPKDPVFAPADVVAEPTHVVSHVEPLKSAASDVGADQRDVAGKPTNVVAKSSEVVAEPDRAAAPTGALAEPDIAAVPLIAVAVPAAVVAEPERPRIEPVIAVAAAQAVVAEPERPRIEPVIAVAAAQAVVAEPERPRIEPVIAVAAAHAVAVPIADVAAPPTEIRPAAATVETEVPVPADSSAPGPTTRKAKPARRRSWSIAVPHLPRIPRPRLPHFRRVGVPVMAGPNPADLEAATIFAEDCVLQGMLLRPDGRVSDTITSHGSLAVHEAEVVALDDGHDVPIGSLDIAPDEYIAIATAAGKGDGTRRRRTVTYAIALSAGPYRIRGHLHAPPSTDPMPYIWRRSSAVPLTNANVRYLVAGTLVTRDLPVVIVRMTTVDAIVDADARPWDAALLMGMRE